MALDPVKNFAICDVSTGYDDLATTVVLSSGHGARLPDPATDGAFNLTWWNATLYTDPADDPNVEIIRVTARTSDTLTITRAQEGTNATAKNTAGSTYRMVLALTSKTIDDLQDSMTWTGSNVITNSGTSTALYIDQTATTDAFERAFTVYSNAAQTNEELVLFRMNNASSTQPVLNITNAGTGQGIFIDQNGNGIALRIDSDATTTNAEYLSANYLTTGIGMNIYTNSASFSGTNGFVRILVDNASATGTALLVRNDGSGVCLEVSDVGATSAHIRLTTDSTNSTPTEGDLWRASDGLYYYDGVQNVNLLAGGLKSVEDFSANDTLLAGETGKVCTNESAVADIEITLPSAVAGLTFTFVVASAYYLRINFATGDKGRYLSTDSALAGYFRSNTVGDVIRLTAISDTIWQVTSLDGTWTVDA
jgi:hypothetical protein